MCINSIKTNLPSERRDLDYIQSTLRSLLKTDRVEEAYYFFGVAQGYINGCRWLELDSWAYLVGLAKKVCESKLHSLYSSNI